MQPAKGSKEEAVLLQLRRTQTPFSVEPLIEYCKLDGVKELRAIIAKLRKMGFGIDSWNERNRQRTIYGYQLKEEAKSEDPFTYLSRLAGKKRRLTIPWGQYRIEVSKERREGKNLVHVDFFKRRSQSGLIEYYVLDDRGFLSIGGEGDIGEPFIPVFSIKYSNSRVLITQEERMVVDHIRAHIIQNFIRQAVEDKGKRKKRLPKAS